MDIKTYIKMCDCPEIQNDWGLNAGDWFVWRDRRYSRESAYLLTNCECDHPECDCQIYGTVTGDNAIWLPHQDQLQEMMRKDWGGTEVIIQQVMYAFYHWLKCIDVSYHNTFDSMEQLWLVFVMEERHGKVWTGQEWVNANTT